MSAVTATCKKCGGKSWTVSRVSGSELLPVVECIDGIAVRTGTRRMQRVRPDSIKTSCQSCGNYSTREVLL